jgi:uncharacterized phage infection (PIP) family protein YhgE
LAPLLAQQRDFNGGTLQLFYTLLTRQQESVTQINAVMAQVVTLQQGLHTRLDDLHTRLDVLIEHIRYHDTVLNDLHARLDTLAAYQGDVNDRITRLAYTVQLLDDGLTAADEASAALAGHLALLHNETTDTQEPGQHAASKEQRS